jgi:HSP90 family molecular chaperone
MQYENERGASYEPLINITINLKENCISVTDNGMGFDEVTYTGFLAPNLSFKKGKTIGQKASVQHI